MVMKHMKYNSINQFRQESMLRKFIIKTAQCENLGDYLLSSNCKLSVLWSEMSFYDDASAEP